MPDQSHVGRKYSAPGQTIDPDHARRMAAAIAGPDAPFQPDHVPPTFAAVYCLWPTFGQLFTDPEVAMNLAGLIHGEQSFEWPAPVQPGDVVDATAEIVSVADKRDMTFVTLALEARRPADGAIVCRGRSMMIIRGGGQ
jgi:acyl dehydratase